MTPGMRKLLVDAVMLADAIETKLLSPWDYSSHAVGACKKLGLIEPVVVVVFGSDGGKIRQATQYRITRAGRAALGQGAGP